MGRNIVRTVCCGLWGGDEKRASYVIARFGMGEEDHGQRHRPHPACPMWAGWAGYGQAVVSCSSRQESVGEEEKEERGAERASCCGTREESGEGWRTMGSGRGAGPLSAPVLDAGRQRDRQTEREEQTDGCKPINPAFHNSLASNCRRFPESHRQLHDTVQPDMRPSGDGPPMPPFPPEAAIPSRR